MGIAVRSGIGEGDLLHSIRSAVADVDRNAPVYEVEIRFYLLFPCSSFSSSC